MGINPPYLSLHLYAVMTYNPTVLCEGEFLMSGLFIRDQTLFQISDCLTMLHCYKNN